jgi:hypothetical protein
MPNTNVLTSLANLSPCLIGETGVFPLQPKRFQAKWLPVRVKKTRKEMIKSRIDSDPNRADLALALRGRAVQSSDAAERLLARG